MKIISWNLNGLMATMNNGAMEALLPLEPDIICLQEIRTMQEPQIFDGYKHIWNHGEREGYSGTAILTKQEPQRVWNGFQGSFADTEGRIITAEYDSFFLMDVYVPNSQKNLQKQEYRREWDCALREYVLDCLELKPTIICGDFNVARSEIDIFSENMRQYWAEQGYASDERSNFETLLEIGLCDAFRELYPDTQSFTWWSNRLNKRKQNRGWRLDYFLVSEELMPCVIDVKHLNGIEGSDHCPILLEAEL